MTRRKTNRKAQSQQPQMEENTKESTNRLVTPESGTVQQLAPIQLVQWMTGMGSAPTIMQGSKSMDTETITEKENQMATAARKLTYSTGSGEQKRTMAEVVKGNRTMQQGLQLKFYPPEIRDGIKVVKLNQEEIEMQYWFGRYAGIEAVYLAPGCSDHTPIVLNSEVQRMQRRKPYRLLNVVLQQEDFKEAVKSIWSQEVEGYTMYKICMKL
ncbi:hypothetical protein A4A49_55807 [Nicotiana attenuata]|uniref:Uncharacterized protein n=1 Tax=Nicotiana attenuata TaxID=49451 RepID=A0A314LAH4_NICAT|nr:hypothetical protein A4A49_55807 [Nicotiana attenuata]